MIYKGLDCHTWKAIRSSVAVADGMVYFVSHNRNVYALDAQTGKKVWAFYTKVGVESSPIVFRVLFIMAVPTAHPVIQHELSYIKHEVEGRYSIRDFIRNDLEQELKIQEMMRKQISRAHELRDFGIVQVLEEVLVDREELAYHLYSLLEDDTLV